ncbi:MAG: CubicO group peptidase (beta-lactamase class C family) [Saprospiraceae bacterium]
MISKESFELMIQDTGLKKVGNPYGFDLYLYGGNPDLGNVVGHTGAQIGCSSFMMILPESNAVVVTASNTSGAGQEVANITIGLFHMIKDYKKQD